MFLVGYRAVLVVLVASCLTIGPSTVSPTITDSSTAELGAWGWGGESDNAAVVGVDGSTPPGRLNITLGCPRTGVDRHWDSDLRIPGKQRHGRRRDTEVNETRRSHASVLPVCFSSELSEPVL